MVDRGTAGVRRASGDVVVVRGDGRVTAASGSMVAGRGGGWVAHRDRAARLRSGHRRRSYPQPRRRRTIAILRRQQCDVRRGGQSSRARRRLVFGGSGLALFHGILPRRRVPSGNEDGGHVVPVASRSRHWHHRRCTDYRKGSPLSGEGSRVARCLAGHRRLIRVRRRRCRNRSPHVSRWSVSICSAAVFVGTRWHGCSHPPMASRDGQLPGTYVRAVLVLDVDSGIPRGECGRDRTPSLRRLVGAHDVSRDRGWCGGLRLGRHCGRPRRTGARDHHRARRKWKLCGTRRFVLRTRSPSHGGHGGCLELLRDRGQRAVQRTGDGIGASTRGGNGAHNADVFGVSPHALLDSTGSRDCCAKWVGGGLRHPCARPCRRDPGDPPFGGAARLAAARRGCGDTDPRNRLAACYAFPAYAARASCSLSPYSSFLWR